MPLAVGIVYLVVIALEHVTLLFRYGYSLSQRRARWQGPVRRTFQIWPHARGYICDEQIG